MKMFEFTVIATGLDPSAASFEDRLYEAGCDDATVAFQKGAIVVDFAREAKNFGHALASAIANVRAAGMVVTHVEPDDLVSVSDIAARVGMTRAAVSNYANGGRGKSFPLPVARVTTDSPLWNWIDVARWFYRQDRLSLDEIVRARLVRSTNAFLAEAGRKLAA
jgi:hypothetical protein